MNYLAHGYRFLDDPLLMAGTAVPDWLCVVDRQVRVRSRIVRERLSSLKSDGQRVATGILQHLADDDRFHRCPRFMMLESELSREFRALMPDPFDHRPPFLGHIVTELMLDAVIAERDASILPAYYRALRSVSAIEVESVVNQLARQATTRLHTFIERFRDTQFLYDYLDDRKLLARLNQVLNRVTLPPLSEESLTVIARGRVLTRLHADELLDWVERSDRAVA